MAKHVPLGEGTINDHEARIEKLEQSIAGLIDNVRKLLDTETPKKKKDKDQ